MGRVIPCTGYIPLLFDFGVIEPAFITGEGSPATSTKSRHGRPHADIEPVLCVPVSLQGEPCIDICTYPYFLKLYFR